VGCASWLINVRKHFLDVNFELHIFEGEFVDVTFDMMLFFIFFLRGSLCELSIFLEGGFLSPPPPELLLITFLDGSTTGELI
jgi:hypothetical protein